jgi:antibiotic biosynthesis monooxygenase (ABM) superfamily enzyme
MIDPAPVAKKRHRTHHGSIPIHGIGACFPPATPAPAGQPPKWKMAIVGFMAIYPLVLLVPPLVAPLLPPEPRWLQILIQMMFITPMMTWVALPLATTIFRRFLCPQSTAMDVD